MEDNDFRASSLEKWLREKCMTTKKFAELVGCSRVIIWKVKRGMAVSPKYADKIKDITGGQVVPISERVGRPY